MANPEVILNLLMAMRSGERYGHTLFWNQELQLWEQTECNKHLNQSLWEFCYWLWSKQVWGFTIEAVILFVVF